MVHINLLPQDYIKAVKFKRRRIPIVPVLALISLCLILYWFTLIFSISHSKAVIISKSKNLKLIKPKKAEVDKVWDNLHNNLLVRKNYIENVLFPDIEWAKVLNAVSDYASQGIWLYEMLIERKDDVWMLNLKGYAKPVTARSMIKDISRYVASLKDILEEIVRANGKKDVKVDEITETKRKKAGNMEITEFNVLFKIYN